MRSDKNVTAAGTGGAGFTGLLTIAFIILKLTHVIEWSWIWVLSPLWIEAIIFTLVVVWLIYKWK